MSNPSEQGWFYGSPEGNKGPFSTEQLMQLAQQGHIGPDTMLWRQGLPNWARSADVPQIAPYLRAQPAPPPPQQALPNAVHQDEHLDAIFVGLVKDSWKRFKRRETSQDVDEVIVGAVITATLDNGYTLIDLESSGSDHYLRFEELGSGCRILFKLTHHAESLLTSQVLGHEATVTIGFGTRVRDFNAVWGAIKQEMKGGYVLQPDPGIIQVDGDISSQYIYVQVGLLWDINDYLNPENPYQANYPKLTEHIGATVHALRKYLHGRLGG